MKRRDGVTFIADVPPGTRLTQFDGQVIAAAPGMPPSIVTDEGLTPILPGKPQCIKVIKPVGVAGRPAVYCSKPALPGSRYCEDHQPK